MNIEISTIDVNNSEPINAGENLAEHFYNLSEQNKNTVNKKAEQVSQYATKIENLFESFNNKIYTALINQSGMFQDNIAYERVFELKNTMSTPEVDSVKPDNYETTGTPVISPDGIYSAFRINVPANGVSNGNVSGQVIINLPDVLFNGSDFKLESEIIVTQEFLNNSSLTGTWMGGVTNSFPFYMEWFPQHKWMVPRIKVKDNNNVVETLDFHLGAYKDYWDLSNFSIGDKLRMEFIYNGTNTYTYTMYKNGSIFETKSVESDKKIVDTVKKIVLGSESPSNSGRALGANINLNAFKLFVGGELVYQPCLKIPYTEAKTGAKIVDVKYMDRVYEWFEQSGKGNYYIIDEQNQRIGLALPDIYGLIESKLDIPQRYVIEKSANELLPSWYVIYNDGWIEQGGNINVNSPLIFLKPFSNNMYTLSISGIGTSNGIVSINDKTSTSFSLSANNETGYFADWKACGY